MPTLLRAFVSVLLCGPVVSAGREARAQTSDQAWVKRSDALAQILVRAQAPFDPEKFSFLGLAQYDDQVVDLRADRESRLRDANRSAKAALQEALRDERDPDVRQDLEVMIDAAARSITESELNERLRLEWRDMPDVMFSGLSDLLSDQIPAERRAHALPRLLRYVGMAPNTTPVTTLAQRLYEQRARTPGLLPPPRRELERALANVHNYIRGTRKLFETWKIAGSEPALAALEQPTSTLGLPVIAHLLPEGVVGTTLAIEPIVTGQSGAQIYAVRTSRGELVLRVAPEHQVAEHWANELRVLRRAAACGVAPRVVHVDEAARATVSVRVAGIPLVTALADLDVRNAVAASMAAQVRALHALDPAGIEERDPLDYARARFAEERLRPGFPAWAAGLEPIFAGIEATLARDPRRVVSHNDLNLGNGSLVPDLGLLPASPPSVSACYAERPITNSRRRVVALRY